MHTQHITEDGGTLYIALPSSMIMLSRWYKTGMVPGGLPVPQWYQHLGSPVSNQPCNQAAHLWFSKLHTSSNQQNQLQKLAGISTEAQIMLWLRVLHTPYSFVFGEGSDSENRDLRMKIRAAEMPSKIHKAKRPAQEGRRRNTARQPVFPHRAREQTQLSCLCRYRCYFFSQENYHGWKPTGWGWDLDLSPASAARHRGTGDKINKHEQFPCSSLQSAVHFWHKITAAFWWQHAIKQLLKYFP